MPTAAEYEDAASRYLRISENLVREAGAVGAWVPGFVSTGAIHNSVDESISRTHTHLTTAGEELYRLARVCEARRLVCVDYARAVRRYRQLPYAEQLQTSFPARPATWVES